MNSNYFLLILFALFMAFRFWKGQRMKSIVPEWLAKGAVIIDVRSAAEFMGGANPQSINIPLDQLSESSLKKFSKTTPILLCCASGMRSGVAVAIVKKFGFSEVMNAGPWGNTL